MSTENEKEKQLFYLLHIRATFITCYLQPFNIQSPSRIQMSFIFAVPTRCTFLLLGMLVGERSHFVGIKKNKKQQSD